MYLARFNTGFQQSAPRSLLSNRDGEQRQPTIYHRSMWPRRRLQPVARTSTTIWSTTTSDCYATHFTCIRYGASTAEVSDTKRKRESDSNGTCPNSHKLERKKIQQGKHKIQQELLQLQVQEVAQLQVQKIVQEESMTKTTKNNIWCFSPHRENVMEVLAATTTPSQQASVPASK